MRIVFMGNPSFACPSLDLLNDSDHEIVGVISNPPKRNSRKKEKKLSPLGEKALELNLNLYTPESLSDLSVYNWIKDLNPDVIIVVAFKIIPNNIIDIPQFGAINLHASLLPKYRGASPIQYALMNGDRLTGNTTFFIIPEVDKGNLILQDKIEIENTDNYESLSEKLSFNGAKLLVKSLKEINRKDFEPIIQNNSLASQAPKITKEICQINWNQSAFSVQSKIRALYRSPGAYTTFNGKRIKILESIIRKDLSSVNPGTIMIDNESLFVSCSDFFLKILLLQAEGKRAMKAEDWVRGINKEFLIEFI